MNIIAPINQLGYGQAGTHITVELQKLTNNVSLFPLGQTFDCHPKDKIFIDEALQNAKMYNIDAPCIRIWHQFDLAKFVGKSHHIGFPIFELDTFTDIECHHLYNCDILFVCSEWAKQVVKDNLYNKYKTINTDIRVVPLGVDIDIFTPVKSRRSTTIFLNVGKWEIRKGHDILMSAFNDAFKESDDVELWMMCENPFLNAEQRQSWISSYKQTKLGDRIRIIPHQNTQTDVARVMQQADCGVFPSRAEGWNLEALEMMACGKDIIITNYSGHTAFCNDDNANLIHINNTEPAYDGIWFNNQGNWAALDLPQYDVLVENLRKIHLDKQARGGTLNTEGVATAKNLTWNNSAKTILDILR